MWAIDAAIADRIAEKLAQLLRQPEQRKDDAPAPQPSPKLEPAPKDETCLEAMYRRARNEVRSGKAVGMTDLARSVPRPRPPRAPDQQREATNGIWSWFR